ncbi:MAG: methenyltetrahydromethanopterin cyclohydrolase [Pseudomonadota bacterium]
MLGISGSDLNVNELAVPLVDELIGDPLRYGVSVEVGEDGSTIIDAGINARGGLSAGVLISKICMGGLGDVFLTAEADAAKWGWHINVSAAQPTVACLGSQYAGWSLSHGEGKGAFFALGSGPGRAMGSREALFEELDYRTPAGRATLVLEVDKVPPVEINQKVCERCGIDPEQLTLILTPTSSLAGNVQIVARVLEVALHKLHELKFPLTAVVDGMGSAPVPPPSPDFMTAMGRTNDAILFGGQVHLFIEADDDVAEKLANDLPSSASRDFGRPFGQVFKEYDYDFYKVDPMLFSPAAVSVTAVNSGHTFHAGKRHDQLLDESFGGV